MVDKDQLIVKQQMQIENLLARSNRMEDDRRSIRMILYANGGPLNDNVLGYNLKQLGPFGDISLHCDEDF